MEDAQRELTMKRYTERGGRIEEIWQIQYNTRGFSYYILVQGTEKEMWDYLDSEMGHVGKYRALSDHEVAIAKELNTPIYLAPHD